MSGKVGQKGHRCYSEERGATHFGGRQDEVCDYKAMLRGGAADILARIKIIHSSLP